MDDLEGILSLYEASHYMVHGENILDEALIFTETALKWMLSNNASDSVACSKIKHALQWPIRKTMNRWATRLYITLYQQDESHDGILLKLAKLDFNALQRMHKRELCALTKWWKSIEGVGSFGFARDKRVEAYLGALGMSFEPQYSQGRMRLAKQLSLTTVMDDAYDECGTMEELLLFTKAIQSWNRDSANNLPSYMRPLYKAILDFYTEIEGDHTKYDMSKKIQYAKLLVKKAAKAFYEEAYWYHNNIVPTMEEYMETGLKSSLATLVAIIPYIGMTSLFTEDVLDWAKSEPLVYRAASTITRLMDDIEDHKDGSREAGAVKCYMSEYGVAKEKAVDELEKQVANAWKDINNECLHRLTAMQPEIIEAGVDIGKLMHTMFKGIDGFTDSNPLTKLIISSLLVDPIN